MVTRASSASNTALITRQVLHPRECCAAGMDLSGEGGSAVRIGDANVTHFCPWLKSSQKSRLARTACRHSGGYSDQVAENLGSAAILRCNLLSAPHTGEMRRAVTRASLSCIVGDTGDQSRAALIAASNLISQIASRKRSYRDSRTEGEE